MRETAPKIVAVVLDQATVEKLPAGVSTLVIGNPMIADVTMLKTGSAMVVTGKGYGQTNLIALDSDGAVLLEQQLRRPAGENGRGLAERRPRTYPIPAIPIACRRCSLATIPKSFNDAGGEISSRNGFAMGGSGGGK